MRFSAGEPSIGKIGRQNERKKKKRKKERKKEKSIIEE
jgi:hypothetical protein